jgi:hypothetical protein
MVIIWEVDRFKDAISVLLKFCLPFLLVTAFWKFAFGYADVYVQPASFFSVIVLLFFIVDISNSSRLAL